MTTPPAAASSDASSNDTAYYRVSLSSGEALATLAVLRALDQATGSARLFTETDIEPGILANAADRLAGELPEFTVVKADRLAAALVRTLREAAGTDERDDETRETPPFPIRRTRRLLEDAYEENQPVEIEYYVAGRKEWTHRRVDISSVYEQSGTWYLSGQCGLRNDHRQFRLDHIRAVRVLDDPLESALDPFASEPDPPTPTPLTHAEQPPLRRRRRRNAAA